MNRTKVTVACKACQKKKVKCTGISPCTNCIRAGHRCEFTGTAKKRGPRNGNVEVIKSSARRIEMLQKNPNLRSQIESLLARNTRPSVRSTRPIPSNSPIVIIDDDSGTTIDASQSHGIPRPTPLSYDHYERHGHVAMNVNKYRNTTATIHNNNNNGGSNNVLTDADNRQQIFDLESPVLRRPIPMYPVNMPRSHVTIAEQRSDNVENNSTILPSISELEASFQNDVKFNMILPTPNTNHPIRKKTCSMIVNSTSGIGVLLPAAPDLANPLDSSNMLMNKNHHHIKLPPLDLQDFHDKTPIPISSFFSLPSPPSSQSLSPPKSVSPGPHNMTFRKCQPYTIFNPPPTPANSSPPSSPRNIISNSERSKNSKASNSLLSRPVVWENHSVTQQGAGMEIDRIIEMRPYLN